MRPSLVALLSEVIDYAGLFPPAQLELDPAIRNFARYRKEPSAGVLGRFVIPAAKLPAVGPYQNELFTESPPARFSALGRGGDTAAQFLENLDADLLAIGAFNRSGGERVVVDAMETKLPADLVRTCDAGASDAFVSQVCERIGGGKLAAGPHTLAFPVFLECPLLGDWRASVTSIAAGVQQVNLRRAALGDRMAVGVKLRTGGLEASAFPSSEQIAFVIKTCRDYEVPLKFTAGLHHPIRRFDPGVRAMMHGFINLFVAGVLAHAVALELHDIQGIIDEQDAREFQFGDASVAWNEAEAMIDEIRIARRTRVVSFGSCSVDEPLDDLRALGWM